MTQDEGVTRHVHDLRIAIVTGGNRGLGFETCRQLAAKGYEVILTCRDPEQGKAAVQELLKENPDCHVISHELDVCDASSVRKLDLFVRKRFGRADVLVNNAGVQLDRREDGSPTMHISEVDLDKVRTTMETNLFGPLLMSRQFLPLMKEKHYGRIVNVSSGLGQLSYMGSGYTGYRLSKAALNALTCIVSDEVKSSNVLVNAACPGWVRTDMGGPKAARSPEEGADTIVWLATLADGGPTGGFFRDRQPIPW